MTEDEARQKWCPMARVADDAGGNVSNMQANWMAKCLASDCMMWRWAEEENRENFYAWAEAASRSKRDDAREKGQPIHRGYCGLAGKPQ